MLSAALSDLSAAAHDAQRAYDRASWLVTPHVIAVELDRLRWVREANRMRMARLQREIDVLDLSGIIRDFLQR